MKQRFEIDEVVNNCADQADAGGSRYPGMTYEEGVEAALRWVTEDDDSSGFPFGES